MLFRSFFKPTCLLKAHLFISWACDPLFLLLGPNGFFAIYFVNFLLPLLLGFFSFCLGSHKWPSTLGIKIEIPNRRSPLNSSTNKRSSLNSSTSLITLNGQLRKRIKNEIGKKRVGNRWMMWLLVEGHL